MKKTETTTRAENALRKRQDLRTQSLLIQAKAGGTWRTINDTRWDKVIERINVAIAANKFTQAQRHIQTLHNLVDQAAARLK